MEANTRKPSKSKMLCFLLSGRDDFNRKTKITMARMDAMIMMEMVNIFILIKSLNGNKRAA